MRGSASSPHSDSQWWNNFRNMLYPKLSRQAGHFSASWIARSVLKENPAAGRIVSIYFQIPGLSEGSRSAAAEEIPRQFGKITQRLLVRGIYKLLFLMLGEVIFSITFTSSMCLSLFTIVKNKIFLFLKKILLYFQTITIQCINILQLKFILQTIKL